MRDAPLWNDADLAAYLGVGREVARNVLRDADRESGGRLLLREVGRWSFLVGTLARLRPGLVRVESGARVAKRVDAIEVGILQFATWKRRRRHEP